MADLMKYTKIKGLTISKMTLGTAQLGMKYGIANVTGQPTSESAYKILKSAIDSGINCFDTAPVYRDSEKVIGSFLGKIRDPSKFPLILTKFPSVMEVEKWKNSMIEGLVEHTISDSLKRLNLDKIPIYFLHDTFNLTSHGGKILEALLTAKESGLFDHLGVSVYDNDEIMQSLEIPEIEAIQVPFNVFDQRVIKSGLLKRLEKERKMVFARSIFLQGLFFLKTQDLPNKVKSGKKFLFKLNEICNRENLSINQLAFNYVRDFPGITSILFGVDTIDQLIQNVQLLSTPVLLPELKKEIYEIFEDVPLELIDPRRWN